MASISRTFSMQGPPEEAKQRFSRDLEPGFASLGYVLRDESPGHLAYGVRPPRTRDATIVVGTGALGWAAAGAVALRRSGHRIEADFTLDGENCVVEIYGSASRQASKAILVLGRNGHWPSNPDDPAWLAPVPEDASLDEWDDQEIDPTQLDRITRRALRKAGRLNP